MSARLDLGPERARYLRARPLHSVVFLLLLATVAAAEAPATRQSGFTRLTVATPMGGGAIQTVVWYPTTAPASLIKLGPFDLDVAINSEPEAGAHPFIVISHGTGGSNLGHHDTAIYLARHGFVVATPMHPGDNFQDTSAYGTDAQLFGRPRHVKAVLDAVVAHPVFGRVVDTARIGIVGMSAGGYTALVLVGGKPDFSKLGAYCREQPADPWVCGGRKSEAPPASPTGRSSGTRESSRPSSWLRRSAPHSIGLVWPTCAYPSGCIGPKPTKSCVIRTTPSTCG